MKILIATLASLSFLLGGLFAWGEADPLAAVIDTRAATLVCGVMTILLALALRSTARLMTAAGGVVLILIAGSWHISYAAEPISFRSDDIVLAGTLYRPRGVERPPVVVFLHGSGRQTRGEFRHYAQLLARHDIASLTYDKRGSGASGGSTWSVGYEGYARDVASAVRYVASRADLDRERIVLHGVSEGGWVVPLALEASPQVRAVIVASTTMMTPADQVLYESGARLRDAGYGADIVRNAQSLHRRALDYQRTGRPSPGLDEDLRRASREPWFEVAELPDRLWPIEEYRWWRGVMDFAPRPHWRRVNVPVLALHGGRDMNSDPMESQTQLRAALSDGGNRAFTGRIFPRAEHGMIEWCVAERIPPPCWPEGMPEVLLAWMDEQVNASDASGRQTR